MVKDMYYLGGIVFVCLFLLSGCLTKRERNQYRFEEVIVQAQNEGKSILVYKIREVEQDDSLSNFQQLERRYQKDQAFQSEYIIVKDPSNVIGNELLSYILCDYRQSLLLEFAVSGELKMIVPVSSSDIVSITDSLLSHFQIADRYHNNLELSEGTYLKLVNKTLQAYVAYKSGNQVKAFDLIAASLAEKEYFFNCYLAARIYADMNEHQKAVTFAKLALEDRNPVNRFLYRFLYQELYFIAGDVTPLGKEKTGLVFRSTIVDCGKVEYNSRCEVLFECKNLSDKPVIITKIDKGCNCMEIFWDQKPLLPGEPRIIKVLHDASRKGYFSKMLAVFTNEDSQQIFLSYKGRVY